MRPCSKLKPFWKAGELTTELAKDAERGGGRGRKI